MLNEEMTPNETLQNLPYFWNTKSKLARKRVFIFQKYGTFLIKHM